MLNASYFRNNLNTDAAALGGTPTVEVVMINGLRHRVRSVLHIEDGYVTIEVYSNRASQPLTQARAEDELFGISTPADTERVTVAYDAIVEVLVNAVRKKDGGKIGFHQT